MKKELLQISLLQLPLTYKTCIFLHLVPGDFECHPKIPKLLSHLQKTIYKLPQPRYLLKLVKSDCHCGSNRRMLFNILAHNRDDHVKNFSFILDAETKEWSLSPAYDLLFSEGIRGEHSMTIAGEGKSPNWDQVKSLAQKASISKGDIASIFDEVETAVLQWPDKAQMAGIPEKIFDQITASMRKNSLTHFSK